VLRLRFWPGSVALLITSLIALPAAGCGASVSVHGGVISGDGPYRAAWTRWWDRIQQDAKPYRSTATSPGVCNVGGSKRACVATDTKVASDLRGLRTALRSVHVAGPYRRATTLTLLAISQDVQGLNLRIRSLSAGTWTLTQRNEWFRQSNLELLAAEHTFARGWAAFPDWAKPGPPPQV
jgi:hypothetical protein